MSEGVSIRLPERLGVEQVADVLAGIPAHGVAQTLRLDCSEVASVDTAGLQLLLVLRRAARDAGGTLELAHVGPELRESARLLGVEASLGTG
ncbi:MAG: STAS domain-containing protein [Pseudomonadota bacterium]